jgi:hypothetical protein
MPSCVRFIYSGYNNMVAPKFNTFTTILLTCIITLLFVLLIGLVPGIDYFRYYVSGYSINRNALSSTVSSVLWEHPKLLEGQMNEVHGNNNATISVDGKTIVLTRSFSPNNKDLYISYYINNKWTKPKPITFLNTEYDETTPEISSNGNVLLFSSNRPGGIGGYDIWCSEQIENRWSKPFLLGKNINTRYNETSPHLTKDLVSLFLSSDRPNADDIISTEVIDENIPQNDFDIFELNIDTENKSIPKNDNKFFSHYLKIYAALTL